MVSILSLTGVGVAGGAGGNVTYVGAHVNRSSAGNDVLDLEFSGAVTGTDLKNFTVECREPLGTWLTLDETNIAASIVDTNYVRYDLSSNTVSTFQASHEIRVSLSSAGDLNIDTFSNDTTLTNNSTIDLLNGVIERFGLSDTSASITSPGNDLTNNNSATFTSGKLGNAVSLVRASNQTLSHADNADFSFNNEDFD